MKEYVAETGGRYTYADDVLRLQELALSMTALFGECADFIISGCEIDGAKITPGYLWLGGKVRRYDGCQDATFPYYLYEHNVAETVTYAKQVNKRGRVNYGVAGSITVPESQDIITGVLPHYISLTSEYAPRLRDKFFGRYAVLLDSLGGQSVKKDLSIAGKLLVGKQIESQSAVTVTMNGCMLRQCFKPDGRGSLGFYQDNVLQCEILTASDGVLSFMDGKQELLRIDNNTAACKSLTTGILRGGSLCMSRDQLFNAGQDDDQGTVKINYEGFNGSVSRFRNFEVYDGKRCTVPLLKVDGSAHTTAIEGMLCIGHVTQGIVLKHPYLKSDVRLTGALFWQDSNDEEIASMGYIKADSFDFTLVNNLGNIVVSPKESMDVHGSLKVNGADIATIYATQRSLNEGLAAKVNAETGKGLSTEDFTSEYRKKLEAITTGLITSNGGGYVTAADVSLALAMKLDRDANLSDVGDAAAARHNLDIYSKDECRSQFFRISELLSEVTALSQGEIENQTPEQIIALKQQKQQTVREHIDAEKKGSAELRLSKTQNLADLADRLRARQNLEVYSTAEVDNLLAGKLGNEEAYLGVVFTPDHKKKLEAIKTGNFAGENAEGVSVAQAEGYALISAVKKELDKKAGRLLEGYSAAEKSSIADNIAVYSKADADAHFGQLANAFQDYVTYQVKQGQSTTEARKVLRDKLDAAGKSDLDAFLRKDAKLSDLNLSNAEERKQACQKLGAAYAPEYQPKLEDTGWISCGGSNAGTLFARQIGNVVCVQGTINTARRSGSTWGECAVIPNQISPPKYGCRQTAADFNDGHVYNRGCSFRIQAGSREIQIHERGMYNVQTELHFSYMT